MFFYTVLTPISTTSGLWSTGNTRKYHQIDVYIYQCEISIKKYLSETSTFIADVLKFRTLVACLQANGANPYQTASEEAVWYGFYPVCHVDNFLWISVLITKIFFEKRQKMCWKFSFTVHVICRKQIQYCSMFFWGASADFEKKNFLRKNLSGPPSH